MALINLEVFASTDDTTPLTDDQQDAVGDHLAGALDPLTAPPVVLVDFDVTPHTAGAVVQVLCLTDPHTSAIEVIAEYLTSAMREHATYDGWLLRAGVTHVLCSDN